MLCRSAQVTLCGSQNRSFQNQARIPAIFALSAAAPPVPFRSAPLRSARRPPSPRRGVCERLPEERRMEACVSPTAADDAAERRGALCRLPAPAARRGQRPPRLSHGRGGPHWLPPAPRRSAAPGPAVQVLRRPPGWPRRAARSGLTPPPFTFRKASPNPGPETTRPERAGTPSWGHSPRPRLPLQRRLGVRPAGPAATRLRASSPRPAAAALLPSRRPAGPGRAGPTRYAVLPGSRRAWEGCRPTETGRWQRPKSPPFLNSAPPHGPVWAASGWSPRE